MIEIKRPTTLRNPDFVTGEKETQPYKFNCAICKASIAIDFDRQINNSWTGRTERINEEEVKELRAFYGIGLSGKSHDGGLPIFDKVTCITCGANYIIYCGVIETSNSAYTVTVNGIIRK
jgi:hypothetical protein